MQPFVKNVEADSMFGELQETLVKEAAPFACDMGSSDGESNGSESDCEEAQQEIEYCFSKACQANLAVPEEISPLMAVEGFHIPAVSDADTCFQDDVASNHVVIDMPI